MARFDNLCQFSYWLLVLGLIEIETVDQPDAFTGQQSLNQPTISQRINKIRRLYDVPRLSMRWATYSGCNLWYFRLEHPPGGVWIINRLPSTDEGGFRSNRTHLRNRIPVVLPTWKSATISPNSLPCFIHSSRGFFRYPPPSILLFPRTVRYSPDVGLRLCYSLSRV